MLCWNSNLSFLTPRSCSQSFFPTTPHRLPEPQPYLCKTRHGSDSLGFVRRLQAHIGPCTREEHSQILGAQSGPFHYGSTLASFHLRGAGVSVCVPSTTTIHPMLGQEIAHWPRAIPGGTRSVHLTLISRPSGSRRGCPAIQHVIM